MGFRSTITTEALGGIQLPDWFMEKWKDSFYFGAKTHYTVENFMLVTSKTERKFYNGVDEEILTDIQKVCKENDIEKFIAVLLHECGGITRVQIEQDRIQFSEPSKWEEVEGVTHNYCYGCSELTKQSDGFELSQGEEK